MIDATLLEILVCPETKQSLRVADDAVLARVNDAIGAGSVKNRGGASVSDRVEAGLVREDGTVLYPVRDGIPIMLIDESISIPQHA